MLAVPAAAAALLHPVVFRQRQRRLARRHRKSSSAIARARLAGSIAMPASIRPRSLSSTANISPVKAQRSSIAACARRVAFLGAVAEPDDPFRANAAHDRRFPFPISPRSRRASDRRFHHRAPVEVGECRVEELPHHGAREIAVRLFQQQQVAVLPDVAQIGELVLVVALAFDLGRIGIEFARLAEQIEAHIGERHVLFQHRRMAAPFRQPMARGSARRRRGAARTAPAAFRRLGSRRLPCSVTLRLLRPHPEERAARVSKDEATHSQPCMRSRRLLRYAPQMRTRIHICPTSSGTS